MSWTKIKYGDIEVEAIDFLDGVLVKLIEGRMHHNDRPTVFAPGWRVEPQFGDMDGPAFRRRKVKPPTYRIELAPEV